jgi:hypothetical protein
MVFLHYTLEVGVLTILLLSMVNSTVKILLLKVSQKRLLGLGSAELKQRGNAH